MPSSCSFVEGFGNTAPTDISRQDFLLVRCCKTVFVLTILQDFNRCIVSVEAFFLVHFFNLIIGKVKVVSFRHRNIRVEVKALYLWLFLLLPSGDNRFRLFVVTVADTNTLVIHFLIAVKTVLSSNDFSVILNRYIPDICCHHISSFSVFNKSFHCGRGTVGQIRCPVKFSVCVHKPFRTYIGKLLICNATEIIKEILCRVILPCDLLYLVKRKSICNILTSGIAVGVIVHPSYTFIVPVNKEGVVITGFRTEIRYGFSIVLSFIFACNGFFFRR